MSWPGRFSASGQLECRSRGSLEFVQPRETRNHPLGTTSLVASSVAAVVGVAYIVATPSNCQLPTQTFLNFLRHKSPSTAQTQRDPAESSSDRGAKTRGMGSRPVEKHKSRRKIYSPKTDSDRSMRRSAEATPAAYSIKDETNFDAPLGEGPRRSVSIPSQTLTRATRLPATTGVGIVLGQLIHRATNTFCAHGFRGWTGHGDAVTIEPYCDLNLVGCLACSKRGLARSTRVTSCRVI